MIRRVLAFQDTRADQIMKPRTEIVALDVGSELKTILATIHEAGHSRIPVYEGNLDNIIGVLYAKDLLWELGKGGTGIGHRASDIGSSPLPAAEVASPSEAGEGERNQQTSPRTGASPPLTPATPAPSPAPPARSRRPAVAARARA